MLERSPRLCALVALLVGGPLLLAGCAAGADARDGVIPASNRNGITMPQDGPADMEVADLEAPTQAPIPVGGPALADGGLASGIDVPITSTPITSLTDGGPGPGPRSEGGAGGPSGPDPSQADAGGPVAAPTDPDVGAALDECERASLTWHSARKTHYTSYPEPGSVECVVYNGCMWAGYFAGCDGKQPEAWVQATNIAAFFPSFARYAHHRLCLRSGDRRMIVHVVDTCGDSDCDGCCTRNQGSAEALIDLESYTDARWGLPDGPLEWADLGAAPPTCE